LKTLKTIYVGVLCNECKFTLKLSLVQSESLKEGQTKLFHLKKGDSKTFTFKPISVDLEYLQISSFNLKMSKYEMKAELGNILTLIL
jgi:hypothetical protein